MNDVTPHMLQLASAVDVPNVEQLILVVEDITLFQDKATSHFIIGVMNTGNRFMSRDIAEAAAIKLAARVHKCTIGDDNAQSN